MDIAHLLERFQIDLLLHGPQYKFYIEVAAVAVLFYIGLTDFIAFKIRNDVVLLLLALYVFLALVDRSRPEIVANVILATLIFVALLLFYTNGVVGGGDVKFMTVVCLWIGVPGALVFSILMLALLGLHLGAAKLGWAATKPMAGSTAIPIAPSVAGALIGTILLGGV